MLYHLFRDRLIFPKLIEKIRELKKQLQVGDVYVEDVAFQKAVLQQLREHDIYARRFAPQRYGDKVARAQMASVRFNAGLVYFLDGAEWLGTLESELTSFPAGKHDDQVDVVSMAGIIATNFRGAPKVNRLPVGPEELEAMALQAGESSNGNIQTLSLENPKYLIPSEDLHPIPKIEERIEYEASGQALIDWLREDSQCPHDWE